MSRVIKISNEDKNASSAEKAKSFSPLSLAPAVTIEERKLAASTLKQARQKAQRVLKQSRQQLFLVRKEYEQAHQKGFEEGLKQGALAVENLWAVTEKLNHEIQEWKEYQQHKLGQEVTSLVEEIVHKVLKREFQRDQRILLQWIQEGLLRLGPIHSARIRLNRKDKEALDRLLKTSKRSTGLPSHIVWVESDEVETGTCVIESDRGEIDLSLNTQEKMISKTIREHA